MENENKPEAQASYLIRRIGGEEDKETRTELPSLSFGYRSVVLSILGFAFIIIIN